MDIALILDIDGVIRDVFGSYHRALADTVEHFTRTYRPTSQDIDLLKTEGIWNNDWEAAQELIKRHGLVQPPSYGAIVEFFQSRYRGTNPERWDGYIVNEPLIANHDYFQALTKAGIKWGFFSGATKASALYVLQRLDLENPILVAMEDAPGKPDPTGLIMAHTQLGADLVIYAGDTAADMLTVANARKQKPNQTYVAVGLLPPHVHDRQPEKYTEMLKHNGADMVYYTILELTPSLIKILAATHKPHS